MALGEESDGPDKRNGKSTEIVRFVHKVELPPVNGLHSGFVPPLVIAVFGSSRAVAVVSPPLKHKISPADNTEDYLNLAFTATLFCGVFQTGLGVFRLGFVTEFLTHATVVGFMASAAVADALQQLKGLLNITHISTESAFGHSDEGRKKKKKKLLWVSAMAPMISVTLSTLSVVLKAAGKYGVKIVRHIKKRIHPRRQTIAALRDYHIDGNEEMMAFDVMNLSGSVTASYTAIVVCIFCQPSAQRYKTPYSAPWERPRDDCGAGKASETKERTAGCRESGRLAQSSAHLGSQWLFFTTSEAILLVAEFRCNGPTKLDQAKAKP